MNKIRYAVVGLGHIAQTAALPGFKHAENSELVALVSGDKAKLQELGKQYQIDHLCSYEDYDSLMKSGKIDAVYIATPNTLHTSFIEGALQNGVHVLCEKPFAAKEDDCHNMVNLAFKNDLKLMIAYRLHFDEANLKAIDLAQSGKLGELRIFNSVFSYEMKDRGNIRLKSNLAGGAIWDIGIYCVNAARYIFQDEPIDVFAFNSTNDEDDRFNEVPEMWSVMMRFPNDRLATFACSFGASDSSHYEVVGTKGSLRLYNAYEYSLPMQMWLTIGEKKQKRDFPKRDQFGAEIEYFSDCIQKDLEPEPSGLEGLADVRIIEALIESANLREAVTIEPIEKLSRPNQSQVIIKPPVKEPKKIHVASPSA
jgi:glucose-fructose oxidoreductase